jgi:hypothetical protein
MTNEEDKRQNRLLTILFIIIILIILWFLSKRRTTPTTTDTKKIYSMIYDIVQQNSSYLSFQNELLQKIDDTKKETIQYANNIKIEITNMIEDDRTTLEALDQYARVINEGIEFEKYPGYTGIKHTNVWS